MPDHLAGHGAGCSVPADNKPGQPNTFRAHRKVSAINRKVGARYERRIVAEQESNRGSDLVRFATAFEHVVSPPDRAVFFAPAAIGLSRGFHLS